jgi:hypothetical protein
MKNPALRKEKRYEPAPVIPLKQDGSLLDWLEDNGRLIYREDKVIEKLPLEDEDISDLSDLIDDQDEEFDEDEDDTDDELI